MDFDNKQKERCMKIMNPVKRLIIRRICRGVEGSRTLFRTLLRTLRKNLRTSGRCKGGEKAALHAKMKICEVAVKSSGRSGRSGHGKFCIPSSNPPFLAFFGLPDFTDFKRKSFYRKKKKSKRGIFLKHRRVRGFCSGTSGSPEMLKIAALAVALATCLPHPAPAAEKSVTFIQN